jgi:subtilase family serine protease
MRLHDLTTRAVGAVLIGGLLSACSGTGSGFSPAGGTSPDGLRSPSRADGAFTVMGRATAATQVNLAVVLNYRNQDQLDKLVDNQSDPASGQYHHFLTQQQFVEKFGPTPDQYQATIKQLRDAGFNITHSFNNRTVIDASAPAPVAENYFSTEIHVVRLADGSARYINTRPETIPSQLAQTVFAVIGLDSAHTMHPQYRFPVKRNNQAMQKIAPAAKGKPPLFGPDSGYGPGVYRASYGFPAKATGKGQATAVVGDADFLDSDLSGFLTYFDEKQSVPTTRVLVDGGPPSGLTGDSVETELDVETIVGIDPDTALYVYEVPGEPDLRYFTDMYNQAVQDNKVEAVNTSYSECETAFIPTFPKAADKIFEQGAAEGITFHASSGDDGTFTYGCSNEVSVGTPTDTPHNVSIGGTTLEVNHTNGKETSEVGWSFGTGGGVSTVFKLPSYQKGVKNIIKTGRNLPDVAFDADPDSGTSLYYNGRFQGPIGGTSLASPIFGAGITAVDEINNSRAGYLNPTMYKQWGSLGYGKGKKAYFRDITSGTIGQYSAMPGYDQMSGIGVMLFGTFGPKLK